MWWLTAHPGLWQFSANSTAPGSENEPMGRATHRGQGGGPQGGRHSNQGTSKDPAEAKAAKGGGWVLLRPRHCLGSGHSAGSLLPRLASVSPGCVGRSGSAPHEVHSSEKTSSPPGRLAAGRVPPLAMMAAGDLGLPVEKTEVTFP